MLEATYQYDAAFYDFFRLHELKGLIAKDKSEHDLVVNRLKDSMAGAERLVGEDFAISWRRTKPRTTTDWQALAEEYRWMLVTSVGVVELNEIEKRHTTTSEGTRPFRVTFEEGEPT